jgi:hypothetical protein
VTDEPKVDVVYTTEELTPAQWVDERDRLRHGILTLMIELIKANHEDDRANQMILWESFEESIYFYMEYLDSRDGIKFHRTDDETDVKHWYSQGKIKENSDRSN